MVNSYAFSFDRETFRGDFETREQAIEAGLKAVVDHAGPADAVYVGKRVPIDPMATDLADEIVKMMRRRMQAKTGSNTYLDDVNEHLLADLDGQIAQTVIAWLRRHDLEPAARIKSISEHPLPSVKAHSPASSRQGEIGPMGGDD